MEFQAAPDAAMAGRMLGYYSDILTWLAAPSEAGSRRNLPREILQKVVYVGSRAWSPDPAIRHANLQFRFDFIDAGTLSAPLLLETGDLGDAVVAVLCADGTDPAVIRAILSKIVQAPERDRADAFAQLLVLSKLRGARPLIRQEYDAMAFTISVEDIDLLREPIDRARTKAEAEGRAAGLAEGRAEGRAEGLVEGLVEGHAEGRNRGLAEAVERVLQGRFPGEVPARLADHLADLLPAALDEILQRSITASSVAEALGSHMPAGSRD